MLHLTVISFFSYIDWYHLSSYLCETHISHYSDNNDQSYNLVMPTEVYEDLKKSEFFDTFANIKVSSFELPLSF